MVKVTEPLVSQGHTVNHQLLDCSSSPAGHLVWARSWVVPSLLSTTRCSDRAARNRQCGWESWSVRFAPTSFASHQVLEQGGLNDFPHTYGLTNDSKPSSLVRTGFNYTLHLKSCGLDWRQWKPCRADGMIVLCPFVMTLFILQMFSSVRFLADIYALAM